MTRRRLTSATRTGAGVGCPLAATVAVLCMLAAALPTAVYAADVPVIGVATGDATRGPLVDHIQAMSGMRLDTPGFDLVAPDATAGRIDASAKASPPVPEFDRDLWRKSLNDYQTAVSEENWAKARNTMKGVLTRIEREGGGIHLGLEDEWTHARALLAEAWILDRPTNKRKKRTEPVPEHMESARDAVRPIYAVLPGWTPKEEYDPETDGLIGKVAEELRRTGTLTVTSPAANAPVYIDGIQVGTTPLEGYRITVGSFEVQAGKPDRLSRVHVVDIAAGEDTELIVDPIFEHDVTTQGYAIVEAPPGQAAAPSAVQVGSGVATLVDTRYALVFAVEGADPYLLYAAMVDAENGVVVRERTVEVEPGPVQTDVLKRLMLYVVDGTEIDTSWPVGRYIWISGFVVGTALVGTAAYFFVAAEGNIADGDNRDQFTSDVKQLEEDAATNRTIGWVVGGVGAAIIGLSVYLLIDDMMSESDSRAAAPGDWRLMAAPLPNGGGNVGLSIVF